MFYFRYFIMYFFPFSPYLCISSAPDFSTLKRALISSFAFSPPAAVKKSFQPSRCYLWCFGPTHQILVKPRTLFSNQTEKNLICSRASISFSVSILVND
mmetsp:Transcript_35583/g.53862  ORF Transcript_35583/g.53862 Transcript_35583/m.53862 type:complete len:99 (+) Transcript_35583:1009-1305(+)